MFILAGLIVPSDKQFGPAKQHEAVYRSVSHLCYLLVFTRRLQIVNPFNCAKLGRLAAAASYKSFMFARRQ